MTERTPRPWESPLPPPQPDSGPRVAPISGCRQPDADHVEQSSGSRGHEALGHAGDRRDDFKPAAHPDRHAGDLPVDSPEGGEDRLGDTMERNDMGAREANARLFAP